MRSICRACPEQAAVVDNGDGSYMLQFRLSLAGTWELAAAVNGSVMPCPAAAAIPAEYGRLTAADCEIEGVDGAVACGTSDPIFVQVALWHAMPSPLSWNRTVRRCQRPSILQSTHPLSASLRCGAAEHAVVLRKSIWNPLETSCDYSGRRMSGSICSLRRWG